MINNEEKMEANATLGIRTGVHQGLIVVEIQAQPVSVSSFLLPKEAAQALIDSLTKNVEELESKIIKPNFAI